MAFGKTHGRNNLGQIDGGRQGRGVKGPGSSRQLRAARTAIGINPLVVRRIRPLAASKRFGNVGPGLAPSFQGRKPQAHVKTLAAICVPRHQ